MAVNSSTIGMVLSVLLKILFLAIIKVFKREGISAQGQATIEVFNGRN